MSYRTSQLASTEHPAARGRRIILGGVDLLDARLAVALGALAISMSAILVALSGTTSSTATVFRCALALPLLAVLALRERRYWIPTTSGLDTVGVRGSAARWWVDGRWHLLAGAFLGADMVFWNESIASSGAGISTVLVNVQVIIVPLVSLLVLGERISARFWALAPLLLLGVAVAGGAFEAGSFGTRPVYGTVTGVIAGVAYAGYLMLLRQADNSTGRMTMLCAVTLSAGLVGAFAGLVTGTLDLAPSLPALGWLALLALSGQILGWVLVGSGLRRLSASTGTMLLLIQPVAAVIFGIVILSERPSPLQLLGCGAVVAVVAAVVPRNKASRYFWCRKQR